jgi:hypothetical protein
VVSGFGFYTFSGEENWSEISIAEYDKLVEKASRFYEGENASYSVDLRISSFKTHTATTPYDVKHGYTIQSGRNYHHYLLGIHSFQNKNYRFVIDSAYRNIMVANPETNLSKQIFLDDYKQFHANIVKVYRIQLKEIDRIKVVFNNKVKISSAEMEMDKNGFLKKTTSYFRVKLKDPKDENTTATSPRIETEFRNYKARIQPDYQEEFDEKRFFSVTNGKFIVAKAYADYTIKDTRLKTR